MHTRVRPCDACLREYAAEFFDVRELDAPTLCNPREHAIHDRDTIIGLRVSPVGLFANRFYGHDISAKGHLGFVVNLYAELSDLLTKD